MMPIDTTPLMRKIRGLNDLLWENHATSPDVEQWLANFQGRSASRELEQSHALYLLSNFMYLGHAQVRHLLRAMFLDLVRNHLTVKVRSKLSDKDDFGGIHEEFLQELNVTRFLGVGNPAESGTHLLYDFRLANDLPIGAFASLHELFTGPLDHPDTNWTFENVERVVFVDDFCGTGGQAVNFGRKVVPLLRNVAKRGNIMLEVWYLTLLGTDAGLKRIRKQDIFDRIGCVSELDSSYRVFGEDSQVYAGSPPALNKEEGKAIVTYYGKKLNGRYPLGFKESQLMVGFHHNIPNNTLPIFSHGRAQPLWRPLFPRIAKRT